jgi:hypothetical protein
VLGVVLTPALIPSSVALTTTTWPSVGPTCGGSDALVYQRRLRNDQFALHERFNDFGRDVFVQFTINLDGPLTCSRFVSEGDHDFVRTITSESQGIIRFSRHLEVLRGSNG